MILVVICIDVIFVILFLLSRKGKFSGAPFKQQTSCKVKENLNILYPAKAVNELQRDYYAEKIKLSFLIVFVGNLLAVAACFSSLGGAEITDDNYIYRNESGKGDKTVEAAVYRTEDGRTEHSDISITVSEQKYTRQETEAAFEDIKAGLETVILGENRSPDEVRFPLKLVTAYKDYPVRIQWTSSNYEYVDDEGNVYNEELAAPYAVVLTAELRYEDVVSEVEFPIVLYPKEYSVEEKWLHTFQNLLKTEEAASKESKSLRLPVSVDGSPVYYVEKRDNSPFALWILSVVCAILVFYAKDSTLQKQIKKREELLLLEYPEFVSKLTLLVNAGMTVRGAIARIISLYDEERKRGSRINYCLEELRIALFEMENGIYEEKAYENFGTRCRIPVYIKLSGLLSQNLKKGAKDFVSLLEKEAKEAYEERKSKTRILGEEAGTKLLFPMILMLFVVMILIIVPAFLSYQM